MKIKLSHDMFTLNSIFDHHELFLKKKKLNAEYLYNMFNQDNVSTNYVNIISAKVYICCVCVEMKE